MTMVTATVSGMMTTEIRASSGLIQIIIASTPITVRADVRIWLRPCCSTVETLSMSLVTRLSTSPWEWLSKYFNGRRASLASTSRRIP